MADKRSVRKSIKNIQRVKTWQLFILLILAALISATFLRLNNIEMVERRNAVRISDERGATADLENNLFSLQRHSAAHMNASSGVIYLQHSYNRDTDKAIKDAQRANSQIGANDVLDKADAACKRQYTGNWMAYVQCVASEQAKYPASSNIQKAKFPNSEMYRHEYLSPFWTPDFAGWSLVVCVILTIIIIVRIITLVILKLLLRRHYAQI